MPLGQPATAIPTVTSLAAADATPAFAVDCEALRQRHRASTGRSLMKTPLASIGLALLLALATESSVSAQEPPDWMKQTLPDQALKPHWDEFQAVMNPKGALDGKTKQLIGLAVAAQIPCAYCVHATTKAAKAAGATDAEIKEAIATAALIRFNSTMLNGSDGGREWPSQPK